MAQADVHVDLDAAFAVFTALDVQIATDVALYAIGIDSRAGQGSVLATVERHFVGANQAVALGRFLQLIDADLHSGTQSMGVAAAGGVNLAVGILVEGLAAFDVGLQPQVPVVFLLLILRRL
ncbi:hypothetical protein D3C73_1044400 [compost metagenome]